MAFKDYSVSGWSLRILTESKVPEVSQRLLKLISIEHREIDETAFSWSLVKLLKVKAQKRMS